MIPNRLTGGPALRGLADLMKSMSANMQVWEVISRDMIQKPTLYGLCCLFSPPSLRQLHASLLWMQATN